MDVEEDSLETRQEAELDVLKSIYDKDVKDLRLEDVWKISRPPEFLLTLRPNHVSQGGEGNHLDSERISLDLHVRFSENYPDSAPVFISPVNGGSLCKEDLNELLKIIQGHVSNNLGEVMMLDIALKVSSWLTEMDERPRFKSCYEEMEARQERLKVQEAEKQREEKAHVERQRELIQQEIARAAEMIKEGKLLRKEESRRKRESSSVLMMAAPSSRRRSSMRSSLWSESSDFGGSPEDAPVELVHYMSKGDKVMVNKGARIGGVNASGGSVYYGILQQTGKMVAISLWSFKTHPDNKKLCFIDPSEYYDESFILRQVASIEQEMSSILKIQRDHPRIAQYMGMSSFNTRKSIEVRVFEEFIPGSNLSYYLMENIPMDMNLLRYISIGILEALDHMHEKNVVHRDLRDTSVFVTNGGCIKVCNWSWDKRIRDLVSDNHDGGGFPGSFPSAIGRGGKKVDIYRFGILALSLSNGFIVQDAIPSIPKSLGPEFIDFLRKCFMKDERCRWTAAQLLEHDFLKDRICDGPQMDEEVLSGCPRPKEANSTNRIESDDEDETLRLYNPPLTRGVSRLNDEFELLSRIGKGGFGEVIKVRNRLDGQTYAIKKIKLNPRDKSVTKKIMREVKLLSRLNHENVVRYYNSWMEVATLEAESSEEDDESSVSGVEKSSSSLFSLKKKNPRELLPSSPFKTPQDLNQEFSLSYSSHQFPVFDDDEYDEEGSSSIRKLEEENDEELLSDDEVFGTSFLPQSWDDEDEEDDIIFQEASFESLGGNAEQQIQGGGGNQVNQREDGKKIVLSQFLYIQMELCDKQTLRNAIDKDLYKDTKRVWRMFREIIEGLLHIHSQGMIHRDLKPVNIFLDSSDHVKIGDFGLATSSAMMGGAKGSDKNTELNESMEISLELTNNNSNSNGDLTGQIGTAMYIAPEVQKLRTSVYNQKVDIYSLGIIFFEMCYNPLKTGMERIKILTDLRSEDILLPPDFDEEVQHQQGYLIRWLLAHDPMARPSSYELLQSDYLPPPQVEEAEVRELVRHTLSNKQSKTYHHLIDAVLTQKMGLADDLKYDLEIPKVPAGKRKRILLIQERVRSLASNIFRRHGGVCVNAPIFMPKGKRGIYDPSRDNLVEVMTRNGGVVSLPHDLRIHFARYLAKSNIHSLKRYCISPVYREEAVFGTTPKELIECAFDIASPEPGSHVADAEVILVVDELIRELGNRERNTFVRLNHVLLIKGLLSHCGVLEEETSVVCDILRERRLTKMERSKRLLNIGLSDQVISSLSKFLEREGSIQEISSHFRHITKRSNEAGANVKKAVQELQAIISLCHSFGVECELVIAPSLVYNPGHFSGMFCHVVKKKPNYHKTKQCDVIAAGGRYDGILNGFYSDMSLCLDSSVTLQNYNYSAVGISISMDKIMPPGGEPRSQSCADVLLCSLRPTYPREKCEVAKRIWSLGLSCYLCDATIPLEDATDLFLEIGASVMVVILGESKMEIRIKYWLKKDSRFVEKKMALPDLTEFLSHYFTHENEDIFEDGSSASVMGASGGAERTLMGVGGPCSTCCSGGNPGLGSNSALLNAPNTIHSVNKIKINFNLKFLDKQRYTSSQKKRLESAIIGRINGSLTHFGASNFFEVLGLPLPGSVIKSLAAYLDLENEFKFEASIKDVTDRHIRYRKDLTAICDEIHDLKFIKHLQIIVLYSCDDHIFKFLLS